MVVGTIFFAVVRNALISPSEKSFEFLNFGLTISTSSLKSCIAYFRHPLIRLHMSSMCMHACVEAGDNGSSKLVSNLVF